MKRIRRLDEATPGLSDYRNVERDHPSWVGFKSHQDGAAYHELREALIEKQRGLCGYCEIALTTSDTQIEHVIPRSAGNTGAAQELDAGNLMACCRGGNVKPPRPATYRHPRRKNLSCDAAKANQVDAAFLDPRELPVAPPLFRVDSEGRVGVNEVGCAAAGIPVARVVATIKILGLNVDRLRNARARRWFELLAVWDQVGSDPVVMQRAAQVILTPREDGRLDEFFSTARSYFGSAAVAALAETPETWM